MKLFIWRPFCPLFFVLPTILVEDNSACFLYSYSYNISFIWGRWGIRLNLSPRGYQK